MTSASWHARIVCGHEVGAGFLVAGRRVLTCAHVVRWSDRAAVSVSFPHARELGELSASVVAHGGWTGEATDPGDVAVLELDRDVPLVPAGFAPPDAAYTEPYPKLVAYGFPEGYDEGTLAEYQAVSGQLIADEWLELVAWHGHGQPLVAGFSGAAATLPDGRVAGMVTAASGAPDVRKGRMLPLDVMARYWPELGELVPSPGHRDDARRRLYALLRRAADGTGPDCDPDRLYVDAVEAFGPPLPPGGFPTLWAAAAYVQWEVPDPEAVGRFADRLRELLDGSPALQTPAAGSGQPGPAAEAAPAWSPVVVEIDHSGAGPDQVTVEVSAYRDGQRRRVDVRRLPRTGVRSYVQGRIDEAVTQLAPDADELVTFVLPREWLNEAVAQWECGADDSTPLGCAYPLVVTDRARHHSGRLRHQLRKKWQKLDTGGGIEVHRVECGTRERPPSLRKRLWDGDAGLAGFASAPPTARQHFEVGLTVPVPVLLWSRTGCSCTGHGDAPRTGTAGGEPPRTGDPLLRTGTPENEPPCPGAAFLDQLTASVAEVPPAELPRHVLSLRLTADAAEEPDLHWARDLQLLWDDPRCFPEPAASLHSPVA
ncbi:trypsin-like peptidase domain-containing protein [Streptomyces actinomycinicus]|uniref:Trypsin-like peptidase domain-containing protein n=1 Tax=Streptomyces actinomycinicus TaxID=1695166 RepID=A0A937JL24_9ACTN|nr:trypsin-like peptidase domain-containing protein [Streptomyces actinomycinicus]MBL1080891.1 trypsin-like peptidase domain-containing protein [Streptomyces actinomycinicus]